MNRETATQGVAVGAIVPLPRLATEALATVPLTDLLAELGGRLEALPSSVPRIVVRQLADLVDRGAVWLETPENRFSVAYLRQLVETYYVHRSDRPELRGATVLELGCGAENPLAVASVMLALGAERAFGVDDSPILDRSRAVKAVARILRAMLFDPSSLVPGSVLAPEEVLHRFRGFDLSRVDRGDASGLDGGRLGYLQQSIDAMSLPDASCDLCCSSAVLEHVADISQTARELARVTKRGGFGVHNIDYNDHGIYDGGAQSPIAFLTEQPDARHVRTCNRVRHGELVRAFQDAGFDVLENIPYERCEPSDADIARLLPRFGELSRDDLSITRAIINVRRRG